MADAELEVGLFRIGRDGVSLVGRTRDLDLIGAVRDCLAAERRRELARLEGRPVRLVPPAEEREDGP